MGTSRRATAAATTGTGRFGSGPPAPCAGFDFWQPAPSAQSARKVRPIGFLCESINVFASGRACPWGVKQPAGQRDSHDKDATEGVQCGSPLSFSETGVLIRDRSALALVPPRRVFA